MMKQIISDWMKMGGFSKKWSVSPLSTQSQALTSASYSGEIEISLLNRVRAEKDPRVSVIPILEQWVGEGEPVDKRQLQFLIREMKGFKRFHHALEVRLSPPFSFSFMYRNFLHTVFSSY